MEWSLPRLQMSLLLRHARIEWNCRKQYSKYQSTPHMVRIIISITTGMKFFIWYLYTGNESPCKVHFLLKYSPERLIKSSLGHLKKVVALNECLTIRNTLKLGNIYNMLAYLFEQFLLISIYLWYWVIWKNSLLWQKLALFSSFSIKDQTTAPRCMQLSGIMTGSHQENLGEGMLCVTSSEVVKSKNFSTLSPHLVWMLEADHISRPLKMERLKDEDWKKLDPCMEQSSNLCLTPCISCDMNEKSSFIVLSHVLGCLLQQTNLTTTIFINAGGR